MDQITKIELDSQAPSPTSKVPLATPSLEVNSMSKSKLLIPLLVVAIVAGSASGFFAARQRLMASGITPNMAQNPEDSNAVKVGAVFGSADEKTFRDSAEGVIQPGGIAGEGSHHLTRGEDKSQWVYLTSSVIDLDNFVGHKVTIWGETMGAKKAGWLMDVGRLKVLELNAAEINAIQPAE